MTGDIVRGCLERWTLLVDHPSSELVSEIAQLPPDERLSETICKLLIRALRYPDESIAYTSAIAIVGRCTSGGPGSDEERCLLRVELLNILSDPPSGLAQAAALTALAVEVAGRSAGCRHPERSTRAQRGERARSGTQRRAWCAANHIL